MAAPCALLGDDTTDDTLLLVYLNYTYHINILEDAYGC